MFTRSFTALLFTQNAESPILPTLHRQLTDKNAESTNFPDPLPILRRTIKMVLSFLPALYPLFAYSLPLTIPFKKTNWSISPSLHLAFTQPFTQEKQKTGKNTGQQHFGMIFILRNQDQRF